MKSRDLHNDEYGNSCDALFSGHVAEQPEAALDYLEGRLDPQMKAALEAHLSTCPECAACLERQRSVSQLLRGTPLQPAPAGLEQSVLGKALEAVSPQQARVTRRETKKERQPSRWSALWNRKVRPWVPATVAVAALLLGILGYGLLQTSTEAEYAESTVTATAALATTTTPARAASPTEAEQAAGSPGYHQDSVSTTLASLPAEIEGKESTTTAAAGSETTETIAAATVSSEETYYAAMTLSVSDRKDMITNLGKAQSPVYFVFTSAESEGPVLPDTSQAVVLQLTNLTGLEPLDNSLALGGPTFAAYLPREDAGPLVDLLLSIRASLELDLHLDMQPPEATPEAMAVLLEHKQEFPELSASRTPAPAVSAWSFTTSTLSRPGESKDGTTPTPDEAGTHVLVIILVRQ